MNQLVRFDTNALNRALVGFDQLWDTFETRFANQLNQSYPPYNILKHSEDSYEIQVAVTGFNEDEISVEIDQNTLIIKGNRGETDAQEPTFLHRGLASRDFTRTFTLAEHMEVGEGVVKNGVLKIAINRVVPEALKPRRLKLKSE